MAKMIWVWLLWNDAQRAHNQRVERQAGSEGGAKGRDMRICRGLSAAARGLDESGVLPEGGCGETLQAMQ